MKELRFAWDSKKARINFDKHGVTFEEARSVFCDGYAVEFYDDLHSEWEDRLLLLGLSSRLRLFLVCHCPSRSGRRHPYCLRTQSDPGRIQTLPENMT